MESRRIETVGLEKSLEHVVRNWLVIQRYRLVFRYRLPEKMVVLTLLGIERTLTYLRILS